MIDIDGSAYSGSGTIVRHAAAYAALAGQPVRVRNARARRQPPGLRPQHLRAIQAGVCWSPVLRAMGGSRTESPSARGPHLSLA